MLVLFQSHIPPSVTIEVLSYVAHVRTKTRTTFVAAEDETEVHYSSIVSTLHPYATTRFISAIPARISRVPVVYS